jgi:hypothetical protein
MLACNLINELEIFCTNKGCTWKGPLEEISIHMPVCAFQEGKLPAWYVAYMKSKESENLQQEMADELLDDRLKELMNKEMPQQSLTEALMSKQSHNQHHLQRLILGTAASQQEEVK